LYNKKKKKGRNFRRKRVRAKKGHTQSLTTQNTLIHCPCNLLNLYQLHSKKPPLLLVEALYGKKGVMD
jgi:hypothetical protein